MRVTYTEAIRQLQANFTKAKFEYDPDWKDGLQTEHEKYLVDVIYGRPTIVYNYPKEIKSFYMRQNDDGLTVAAMDVLVPGIGELIGGS